MPASHVERAVLAGRKDAASPRAEHKDQIGNALHRAPQDTAALRRALGQPLPRKEADGLTEPAQAPAEPAEMPPPAEELQDAPERRPAHRRLPIAVAIAASLAASLFGYVEMRRGTPPDVPYQSVARDMPSVSSSEVLGLPAPDRIEAPHPVNVRLASLAADFAPRNTRSGRVPNPPSPESVSLWIPAVARSAVPNVTPRADPVSSVSPRRLAGLAVPDAAPQVQLAAYGFLSEILVTPPDLGSVVRERPVALPAAPRAETSRPVVPDRVAMPGAEPVPASAATIRAIALPAPLADVAPEPRPASVRNQEATPDRATPVAAVREAAQPTASRPSGSARIVIHHVAGSGGNAARNAARIFRAAGFGWVEIRSVGFGISETNIRYFFDGDRASADRLAAAMNRNRMSPSTRDFTFYDPLPSRGTIEVWLAN